MDIDIIFICISLNTGNIILLFLNLLLLLLSRFSPVQLCVTPSMVAHQAPRPQDSPGKNTGVGCHFLLQLVLRDTNYSHC